MIGALLRGIVITVILILSVAVLVFLHFLPQVL